MTGHGNERPNELIEGIEYNYAITTAIPGGSVLAGSIGLMTRCGPGGLGFTEAGRRPLDPPPPSGTGTGVVWRLTR